ncbi:hypothetical protein AAFF_G00106870 [Aldrovandia affinis]|uniref:Uncharacterized protein n=1 Tax=Aldrovandia affinis TaxID=143900 RepID=A0AAD7T2C2_9TELE|nr:hypothetical protein AAFF_G00106870 [Aldrovandia affinis]
MQSELAALSSELKESRPVITRRSSRTCAPHLPLPRRAGSWGTVIHDSAFARGETSSTHGPAGPVQTPQGPLACTPHGVITTQMLKNSPIRLKNPCQYSSEIYV